MRIISGKFKGRKINFVKNFNTRPLKDSVRENIFNILNHSTKTKMSIENSSIFDIYSGTGSFGLECISRNAKKVTFVEKNLDAIKILKDNLKKLSVSEKAEIIQDQIENINFSKIKRKYQIFFFDPPFNNNQFIESLISIKNNKIFDKNSIVIIHREKNSKDNYFNCLNIINEKVYGRSKIIFGSFT